MNEYIILKANVEGYDRLVLCLSFESLLSYINKIEDALSLDKKEERILIDQLLITGNGTNRFMSCEFSNGKIDFKTAQIVNPDEYYRKETVDWLHDNYSYVENSILTDEQRQKIKNGLNSSFFLLKFYDNLCPRFTKGEAIKRGAEFINFEKNTIEPSRGKREDLKHN